MGGVCIECGNDSGTNAEDCMECASFVDGRAAERARIIARIRDEARWLARLRGVATYEDRLRSTELERMADLLESEGKP